MVCRMSYWLLLLSLASMVSCRSTDKAETSSLPEAAAALPTTDNNPINRDHQQDSTPNCSEGPKLLTCCEAMNPTCNDCRARNRRLQQSWDRACLPVADVAPDCKKDPPIIACCNEPTQACRHCREAAFETLMNWKNQCATLDQLRCDRAPPRSECCSEGSPACESCKQRNQRIRDEWLQRCGRTESETPPNSVAK